MIDQIFLIVDPSKVYLLKFILEGYDNLFVLSTVDRARGLVEIAYEKSSVHDLCSILIEIMDDIGLMPLEAESL